MRELLRVAHMTLLEAEVYIQCPSPSDTIMRASSKQTLTAGEDQRLEVIMRGGRKYFNLDCQLWGSARMR